MPMEYWNWNYSAVYFRGVGRLVSAAKLAMQADLEVRLIHDGTQWIASHEHFKACGHTLKELDQALIQCLLKKQLFPEKNCVMVFMVFDYSCIPTWIRQYAYHYFNRHIQLNLQLAVPEEQ